MNDSEDKPKFCLFPSAGSNQPPLFASAISLIDQSKINQNDPPYCMKSESLNEDVKFDANLDEEEVSCNKNETDKSKKHYHKNESEKSKSKERSDNKLSGYELENSSVKFSEDNLFRIVRKYVKDNLMYESLYAGDVPKYRINGPKSSKYNKNKRYFNSVLSDCNELNQKSIPTSSARFRHDEDFIKLIEKENTQQKISNQLEIQKDAILTDEIKYDNPNLSNRIKEYNYDLKMNPTKVNKWIEFIQFQDEIMFESNIDDLRDDTIESTQKKSRDSVYLTEKKLLVIEKALKSNPADIRLKILKLELLRSTIESDKLNEEWSKFLFIYPTNFEIIKNYMKFIVTHSSYFSVDNLNNFFKKFMEKIVQYQEGNLKSIRNEMISNTDDLEKSILEALLFYTIILKQCGFLEKSISIWQTLIEFNFNKPDLLNEQTSLDDCKEYFEVFWSSGQDRFGEKHSIGWKKILKNQNQNLNKQSDDEKSQSMDDKENQIVLNSNSDINKIWFEIELIREKYNWLSSKPHEESDDADHIVLFEDISSCLFRFKNASSYQNCLICFLCFLNAINYKQSNGLSTKLATELENEPNFNLPIFFVDNEAQFFRSQNFNVFTPKYFTYDQRLKFIISVFHQSMALVENKNLNDYHQLVAYYLNFIISNINQLDKDQSRKLFKQILKKPSNCGEIRFWKKFVELEVRLNEETSARKIFDKISDMLINRYNNQSTNQPNDQFKNESLCLIHDFIEFNLKIRNIKHISLGMINFLKIDDNRKEKQIGEEILLFSYSLMNSRSFKKLDELNSSTIQLRTKQKINKQLDECFEQVINYDNESTRYTNNKDQIKVQINKLMNLIVLKIYENYFHRLLDRAQSSESAIGTIKKTSDIIDELITKLRSIKFKAISDYLIEQIYEKYLDLHLLYLKYNFNQLTLFNKLLIQAIEEFPTNQYFLTLLVNTEPFRCVNGQIEKFIIRLCRQIHRTTLEQWLFVIYSLMQRLFNIQQLSIQDFINRSNNLSGSDHNQDIQGSKAIDHSGTYSIGLATRIRNLFEKALQIHNSLLLWRQYIHFEVNQNNLEKAKILFYRAAQQCPWNKLLYMDGVKIFTIISVTMDESEKSTIKSSLIQNKQSLDDLVGLMIEKQLRVRTAVEEVQFLIDNQALLNDKRKSYK